MQQSSRQQKKIATNCACILCTLYVAMAPSSIPMFEGILDRVSRYRYINYLTGGQGGGRKREDCTEQDLESAFAVLSIQTHKVYLQLITRQQIS